MTVVLTGAGGDDEVDIIYHDILLSRKAVDITLLGLLFNFMTISFFSTKFFSKKLYN